MEAGREVRVFRVPGQARVPQHAPAQVGITKGRLYYRKIRAVDSDSIATVHSVPHSTEFRGSGSGFNLGPCIGIQIFLNSDHPDLDSTASVH